MDTEKISKFISTIRTKIGLTQKELADKIGVSDKTISKWETGKSLPDISYYEPLCDALNIKVNELLSGEYLNDDIYLEKAENNFSKISDITNLAVYLVVSLLATLYGIIEYIIVMILSKRSI